MKKLHLLFIAALLTITFIQCTNDLTNNDNLFMNQETMDGELLVVMSDNIENELFVPGDYKVFFVESTSGDTYEVRFQADEINSFLSKSSKLVRIESEVIGEYLSISTIQELADNQITTRGPGNAKVLVAMVSDENSTPNCTAADMEYQLVGPGNAQSTANLFTATSKGRFTIASVTTTDVTIGTIPCGVITLSRRVDPILKSQGFNLKQYDYIIYVTAPICSYGGQAILGGDIVHNAYCTWAVVNPHEIGHCLNMNHSTSTNANGSVSAYGDPSCVMATTFCELNAPHRIEKGWIKGRDQSNINNSGTYYLSPLEIKNPPEKQIFKVDVGMINFGRNESYYLSYRAPIGAFDVGLSTNVLDKLSIHSWSGQSGWVTRYIDAIDVNETFTDSTNGVIFKNLGIINEVMTISVDIF